MGRPTRAAVRLDRAFAGGPPGVDTLATLDWVVEPKFFIKSFYKMFDP